MPEILVHIPGLLAIRFCLSNPDLTWWPLFYAEKLLNHNYMQIF